jgi:hypothetical protein
MMSWMMCKLTSILDGNLQIYLSINQDGKGQKTWSKEGGNHNMEASSGRWLWRNDPDLTWLILNSGVTNLTVIGPRGCA